MAWYWWLLIIVVLVAFIPVKMKLTKKFLESRKKKKDERDKLKEDDN
jgi:NADH:ubiquinone oxidoreductase subunit 3 (subunit A)